MTVKKIICLALPLLISCSDKNTRYADTRYLEMPPEMEVVRKPSATPQKASSTEEAGLGDKVSLFYSKQMPVIKIKKAFDRSWDIVKQALVLNKIEITDKNRDEGVFYVLFDPDTKSSDESGIFDSLRFSLFSDEYEASTYKLTVVWHESDTEVSVEQLSKKEMSLLDDEDKGAVEDDNAGASALLIKRLYKTIKHDVPLNH